MTVMTKAQGTIRSDRRIAIVIEQLLKALSSERGRHATSFLSTAEPTFDRRASPNAYEGSYWSGLGNGHEESGARHSLQAMCFSEHTLYYNILLYVCLLVCVPALIIASSC